MPTRNRNFVTVKWLKEQKACPDQVAIVRKHWGTKRISLTLANLEKATNLHLDLDWLAWLVLTAPAWEAYEKAQAPAWEAYKKARAPAWEAYKKARAPVWEAYKKAQATAWEAYEKAQATAWEAYEKARATALFNALNSN